MCIRDRLWTAVHGQELRLRQNDVVRELRVHVPVSYTHLGADVVEGVLLCRNVDALAELIEACLLIDEGELDENRCV